ARACALAFSLAVLAGASPAWAADRATRPLGGDPAFSPLERLLADRIQRTPTAGTHAKAAQPAKAQPTKVLHFHVDHPAKKPAETPFGISKAELLAIKNAKPVAVTRPARNAAAKAKAKTKAAPKAKPEAKPAHKAAPAPKAKPKAKPVHK